MSMRRVIQLRPATSTGMGRHGHQCIHEIRGVRPKPARAFHPSDCPRTRRKCFTPRCSVMNRYCARYHIVIVVTRGKRIRRPSEGLDDFPGANSIGRMMKSRFASSGCPGPNRSPAKLPVSITLSRPRVGPRRFNTDYTDGVPIACNATGDRDKHRRSESGSHAKSNRLPFERGSPPPNLND